MNFSWAKGSLHQFLFLSVVAVVGSVLYPLSCDAGGGPENVFLVVNSSSPASLTVANHYIDLRKIPPSNVCFLKYPPGRASMGGDRFKKVFLEPIIAKIKKRKLTSQIDYIVYSCDFPWRVNFAKVFPTENFSRQQNPYVSLSSATYLSAFVLADRKEMFGSNANFYCSPANNLVVVSRGFRSSYRWSLGGRRAGADGLPYMLSSVLGVNSVPGNTVDEIAWYLKRSAEADGTKPAGTIYFAKNKTIRSTVRDKEYLQAVAKIQLAGVKAEVIEGYFPEYKQNVAGVTCGHSLVNPAGSHCRFLPGAFIDNLTSAGGQFLPGKNQTCLSEFLRMGAAGACGTVVEPFALAPKFPNSTQQVHYVHGCSLAESFYQSVASPFQQILVGDPLCQPWAKIPEVSLEGIKENSMVEGKVTITPQVSDIEEGVADLKLFVDGVLKQQKQAGQSFQWDTTKIPDGYHELRVVATDNTPIETQGRWLGQVIVKNGSDAVQVSVEKDSLAASSTFVNFNVNATNQDPVALYCNDIELGKIDNGNGQIAVAKEKLGAGPITLTAISKGKPGMRSRPLRIELTD
ncbi:Ig-like domain-containing protein [Bythopirellula goksoeyrii]|nr:Ig-like domain-containing protein [Bythopirellula goksoeyrii]